ncbi:MAG: cation diffusion facilitator family transporter [Gaiellales bacterium]
MTLQRRTALVSVLAACVLIALKLGTGLATGSLGFISEAAHSGTDLVAALLTFFAVGVAVRPADRTHPYGHGKAEHLAALGEAAILVVVSLFIAWRAIDRLVTRAHPEIDAAWWAFAVIGIVIAIDLARAVSSSRASRRFGSPALAANALHFTGDLAGSLAVLIGLVAVRGGFPEGDAAAALLVAILVLVAAGRLMRRNVDVLMDRAPASAEDAARRAIESLRPPVELRRLRLRESAGNYFADVVIGLAPGAAVAQAHTIADAVEDVVESALPGADVVVHVEPTDSSVAALRERALEAALRIPRVREIHNVNVLRIGDTTEVSLHLKLPGTLSLAEAHEIGTSVEEAIAAAVPEVDVVQTHLEPLTEPAIGRPPRPADVEACGRDVREIVREATGAGPLELRFLNTDDGLVAFLTLAVDPGSSLTGAHARASDVEARIRSARPEIADVIVHTEPAPSHSGT